MAEEKRLENRIKNLLTQHNSWYVKYWGGGQYTKVGVPDIIACVNGYMVAIEVKATNGKPSALQIHNLEQIHKSGGYAILLYPKNEEEFKKFIVYLSNDEFDAADEIYNKLKEEIDKWKQKLQL